MKVRLAIFLHVSGINTKRRREREQRGGDFPTFWLNVMGNWWCCCCPTRTGREESMQQQPPLHLQVGPTTARVSAFVKHVQTPQEEEEEQGQEFKKHQTTITMGVTPQTPTTPSSPPPIRCKRLRPSVEYTAPYTAITPTCSRDDEDIKHEKSERSLNRDKSERSLRNFDAEHTLAYERALLAHAITLVADMTARKTPSVASTDSSISIILPTTYTNPDVLNDVNRIFTPTGQRTALALLKLSGGDEPYFHWHAEVSPPRTPPPPPTDGHRDRHRSHPHQRKNSQTAPSSPRVAATTTTTRSSTASTMKTTKSTSSMTSMAGYRNNAGGTSGTISGHVKGWKSAPNSTTDRTTASAASSRFLQSSMSGRNRLLSPYRNLI